MPVEYDPHEEHFDESDCGAALLEAIRKLADDSGRAIAQFSGRPLAEIAAIASDVYGDSLPEFWVVWNGWHASGPTPEMGEL